MWEVPNFILYSIFAVNLFLAFFYLGIFLKLKIIGEKTRIKKFLDITFVIPAYNAEKLIDKTVGAVMNSKYPKEKIKIIIVNDGSKDNTLGAARKLALKYGNIEVLDKKNSGKADSLNYGLKRADTELVAVLDADTLVQDDLIQKCVSRFEEKSVVAATCRFKALKRKKLIERLQNVEYVLTAFYRKLTAHINSLPAAPAFTVFKRAFLVKHGYFDPGNLTEDFEIGLRIQKHHYNIAYVSDSYALTDVPDSIYKLHRQRLRWNYGALFNYSKYKELLFSRKHGDLGMFVIPSGYLTFFVVCLSVILTFYSLIGSAVQHFRMIMAGWLPSFTMNSGTFLMSLTDLKVLLIISTFLVGLIMYFLARIEVDEDIPLFDYIIMVSVYLMLLAFFYAFAVVYYLSGKKPRW